MDCSRCEHRAMVVKTKGTLIKKDVITYECGSQTTPAEKKKKGCA
jgi:hypothetical protein